MQFFSLKAAVGQRNVRTWKSRLRQSEEGVAGYLSAVLLHGSHKAEHQQGCTRGYGPSYGSWSVSVESCSDDPTELDTLASVPACAGGER